MKIKLTELGKIAINSAVKFEALPIEFDTEEVRFLAFNWATCDILQKIQLNGGKISPDKLATYMVKDNPNWEFGDFKERIATLIEYKFIEQY